LNVKTGAVLAMASLPNYDPNDFVRGISSKEWKELSDDIDSPLSNKAISRQYPPGSTFKPMVALSALEKGVITRTTKLYCPGYYEFGGRKFHCWNKRGHGNINVEEALMWSCNVFFYKVSHKLGVDNIAETAEKFGLGKPTGIELSGEKSGLIPTKAWKMRAIGEQWWPGETLSVGIGQGYTLATPLQLAVMTARLASGGRKIIPHIIKNNSAKEKEIVMLDSGEKILIPKEGSPFEKIDVNKNNLRIVTNGMNMVVNDKRGIAYRLRLKDPEWAFAGKTGTAQVISKKRFEHLPKERAKRYHSLFLGFAPVNDPTYAISIVIEHGGYGSAVAAPMGREIFAKIKELYG